MSQVLRPYQSSALNRLRQGVREGAKAQVLMGATGSGKTTQASALISGAVAKGNRAFFIVDSLELVDQAARRFIADGLPTGVIQGQHELTDYAKPVQVATIQTLSRRWQYIAEHLKPAVVVIDECHVLHSAAELIVNECKHKNIPVIGLSATPFRKGLGNVFDSMVVGATTAQLTEQGYLVPAICYAPFVPDLKGVKTKSGGDWMEDALAELMGDADIVGDVVENWLKLGEGRQTIVFAANVAHSRLLDDEFRRRGIRSAHIDGYERDPVVRTEIINKFRSGEITVLCNCAILTKGFDAPETSCIVIARPTKSLMLHIQMIGRGLRTAPGKSDCIVIDHAGNCLRNGLPTDDLPQELDDGKIGKNLDRKQREEKEPVLSPCGSCGFVSTMHKCPACGWAPQARKNLEVIDGELYEITSGATAGEKFTTEQRLNVYAQFLHHARATGKKDGWAYYKTQEYTGSFPHKKNGIDPRPPTPEVAGWIKHSQIKWAKSRKSA